MRFWGLATVLVMSSVASAQVLTDSDRFGKSVDQVLAMGREAWTSFYCSNERGGPNGREQAELAYCLALHDRNERVAASRSPQERLYYDNSRALFADMAKNSFLVGMALYPRWEGWPLEINRSSTAVNQAVWNLIRPSPASHSKTFAELRSYWQQSEPRWSTLSSTDLKLAQNGYASLRGTLNLMEKRYRERPREERLAVISFADEMLKMALTKR